MIILPNRRRASHGGHGGSSGGGNEFTANYNDFTYVDPSSKISAQDATSITTISCTDQIVLYGYQDMGADYFNFAGTGVITIDYDFNMAGGIKNGNHYTGLGDSVAGFQTATNMCTGAMFANWGTSVPRLLYGYSLGVFKGSSTPLGVQGTWYYGRVTLDATGGAGAGTYDLEVFSDSARTTSLGSLTQVTGLTYPSGFRYAYCIDNGRNIAADRTMWGTLANLKITW